MEKKNAKMSNLACDGSMGVSMSHFTSLEA
jgi:hypothetical protein